MTDIHEFLDFDIDEGAENLYNIILVDGQNLLHRAAHSFQGLGVETPDGEMVLTGATFGFFQLVSSIWEKWANTDTKLIICWEGGYKHRLNIYPEYKANRRNRDPADLEPFQRDLPNQGAALRRILAVAGWCQAMAPGYEADDVLATLAKTHGKEGKKVAIYTMDQDLHQCVTENVHVVSPKFGSSEEDIWTLERVTEKWGLPPDRIPEAKALAGDSGDNIPGCPGCGKGWAKKLLASAQLVEVLDRAAVELLTGEYEGKAWRTPSLTTKIKENRELILISLVLATTVEDCQVEITHPEAQPDRLRVAFERLEFHSLLNPVPFKILTEIA